MKPSACPDSVIEAPVLRVYRETAYHVYGRTPITLRIGQTNADLLAAHKRQGVICSAFVTAQNPYSERSQQASNEARQQALIQEVEATGLKFRTGLGRHPSNGWPGEESLLVFGLNQDAAKAVGKRFEQNAIVWTGVDGIPQLVLLR